MVTYRTLTSLYVCVWFGNTLTSTAPIGADYLRQPVCDLQLIFTNNRKGIYLSVQKTLVGAGTASYPDVSLSMKMCAQRKAGSRQQTRLPSVPFPSSLAVHHQSLAITLRKTKRLRRRLGAGTHDETYSVNIKSSRN